MRCSLKTVLIAFSCGVLVNLSQVEAAELQTVGQGQFRYLFWDVYQARLATADGTFSDYEQSKPALLELTYQRDISKTEFVEATLEQWQKQQGKLQPRHRHWATQLTALWRDVAAGDRLSCLYREDGLVEFSFNGQPLGVITDPTFGPEFLDIWLGKNTTAPALRTALLGKNNDGS